MMRRFFPLLAAFALTVAMTATAFAQTPYDEDNPPAVTVSAETTTVGEPVTLEVAGLFPGESFDWVAQYNPVIASGTGDADAAGVAAFDFEVPEEAAGETVVVTVAGEQSGELAAVEIEVQAADEEVVDAGGGGTAGDDDDLPETGADTILFVLGGLLLVGIGGGALLLARRRDRSTVGA